MLIHKIPLRKFLLIFKLVFPTLFYEKYKYKHANTFLYLDYNDEFYCLAERFITNNNRQQAFLLYIITLAGKVRKCKFKINLNLLPSSE